MSSVGPWENQRLNAWLNNPELLPSLAQSALNDRGPISELRYVLYPESMESRSQTGNGAHCCDPCVAPAAMPRTVAWLQSITLSAPNANRAKLCALNAAIRDPTHSASIQAIVMD